MKTYRVFVTMETYLYKDIEAEDEDDVYDKYLGCGYEQFTEYDGDWKLGSIEEIEGEA